jgi:hypothetical protein
MRRREQKPARIEGKKNHAQGNAQKKTQRLLQLLQQPADN